MNRFIFAVLFLSALLFVGGYAQNSLSGKVIDEYTNEKLVGVNIKLEGSKIGTSTDGNGNFELLNIPNGWQKITFSYIGYEQYKIEIDFPHKRKDILIELKSETEEFEEVMVNATRLSRTIDAEPTRVEIIAGEEIDEKITMDPSSISMILNESTGIQVQQTSAASANNVFRIQGLDGKYTQLLKDGFPLFGGFSGSLSLVQVPPLDLKQVEVIKGSTSTLYGGGAIAGLIDLITKQPDEKGELSFLLNGTSASGLDLSGFYSEKFENTGITVLTSRNIQSLYDNNDDGFSDLPQIERYTFNPKFYFYFSEAQTLELGGTLSIEDRIGGYIDGIESDYNQGNYYFEENLSRRYTLQSKYSYISENSMFTVKNSISYFKRELNIKDYSFEGGQLTSFSEAVYSFESISGHWLAGLNLYTEDFNDKTETENKQTYDDITYGSFLQNNIELSNKLSLETGFRLDYNNDYGFFPLPRINLLIDWGSKIKSRVGGGLGYKIPTIFNEESDELAYKNISPLNREETTAEKSYGVNFDIDYKTLFFDKLTFSINNLFFYTRINDPLYLGYDNSSRLYSFSNFKGHIDTRGIEINLKLTYDHYKLFAGYTFTDVESHSRNELTEFPLTPKHNLGIVLIYEVHGSLRIGLEGYYTGVQKLSSGEKTTDYWVNGLMIEKHFSNISLFLNFENFLDTRQSKYGEMYTGTIQNPEFAELYAPTDGRIINGGVKIRL
jgi:iron complex outermembrane receptor protein